MDKGSRRVIPESDLDGLGYSGIEVGWLEKREAPHVQDYIHYIS
jgi:hypothetical protein